MFVYWCRFLARHRPSLALVTIAVLLPGVFWVRWIAFSSKLTDYYPGQHPHVRLYQDFTEMLKMTNMVVVTITVKNDTIYTPEALGKIHRITVALLDTKGVNPFEVMSLTHPRLKDIKVRTEGISILPVVDHPEQPQTPEMLARIKNAVYTNLGIRGIYISPDDKTALIRAGFWDGMAEPRAVLARLHEITAAEQDSNTDVSFTGNLVLAGWLIDTAPRVLFLLFISGGVALLLSGQTLGSLSALGVVLLVNGIGLLGGFGLLGITGLALEPLAVLTFLPLCIRGITLVASWYTRLASEYRSVVVPFAEGPSRVQALERTAAALGRPLAVALCVDTVALGVLTRSDVPALQALGYLGVGWIGGLFLSLWTVLPLWSSVVRLRATLPVAGAWGERLTARMARWLGGAPRFSFGTILTVVVVSLLGFLGAMQLEAGRSMMGTTLFYPSHPYNHAFALVNDRFIGINQLTVIAQATGEAAFRNPKALEALEAFQHHMAEDEYFGGALAITGLAKSITRMFHEDIPKWEMIPSDIDSTGQVIFRLIMAAATPSEVERFLSTDFRTTAVTFFYRDYSPAIVERILARAQAFMTAQNGSSVEFRLGGGILGILAAVHAAVEANYWRIFSVLMLLTFAGALLGFGTLRAAVGVTVTCALSQGVMLALLWLGSIDFNMYTLPIMLTSLGIILIPTFLAWAQGAEPTLSAQALAASGLTVATAAAVWLFSPLRLQAEMGVLLIVLTLANVLFPLRIQKSLESGSPQSRVKNEEGGSLVPN